MTRKEIATRLSAFGMAGFLAVAATPLALAHDSVIGGNITSGEVLEELPEEITLEFSAIPREGFNTFAVSNVETKEILFDAVPEVNDRNLTVEVPEGLDPGPGSYQVGYSIVSSDGHATKGSIPFQLAQSAEDTTAADDSAVEDTAVEDTAAKDGEVSATAEEQGDALHNLPTGVKFGLGIGSIFVVLAVIIMFVAKNGGGAKKG